MKTPDTATRIAGLTAMLINARLAQPPGTEELDWIEALHQDGDSAVEDRISRELFWEHELGLDYLWPTPTEADFDSAAEYQQYLEAVAG